MFPRGDMELGGVLCRKQAVGAEKRITPQVESHRLFAGKSYGSSVSVVSTEDQVIPG